MIGKIKNYLWKTEGIDFSNPSSNIKADFNLAFEKILIGILTYEDGYWIFKYSDEFKKNEILAPIIDFPDKDKVYTSPELWPFFASRIPSLNQPFHDKKIKKANADKNDSVALLRLFGKNTITNPFRLSPV
jgi:HipA-like protein